MSAIVGAALPCLLFTKTTTGGCNGSEKDTAGKEIGGFRLFFSHIKTGSWFYLRPHFGRSGSAGVSPEKKR